jgi:hypothetical protein
LIFHACLKLDLCVVLIHQRSLYGGSNETIPRESVSIIQIPSLICGQKGCFPKSPGKKTSKSKTILWKYFLPIVLLLSIGCGVLSFVSTKNMIVIGRLSNSINLSDRTIQHLEAMSNQSMQMIQQWQNRVKHLEEKSNSYSCCIQ